MNKIVSFVRDLHQDNSGASFIEYTALLGVILAVGIGVLTAVGGWANSTWVYLCSQLSTSVATCSYTP
jgi:Flp pilus assembly pilin Flp